jgi:hypothetical protein
MGSEGGAREFFRGEDFPVGGRGRGMTLWLEASSGVILRSLLFGVTRPMTSTSSVSSNPSAAPSGLRGVFFVLLVGTPDPKTPRFFVGVARRSFPSGGGTGVQGIDVVVFCRFAEGKGSESAGSSPVVGGVSGRNRFFATARCTSWDSGVVIPNRGPPPVTASSGEKYCGSPMEMVVSFGAPFCFLGVEVTACEKDNA